MRAIYELEDPKIWEKFYHLQAVQSGHGLPGFSGMAYQRGMGIGSFFRNLVRMVVPAARSVAKTAGKEIAKEALIAGSNIAGDLAEGKDFKQSVSTRGKRAAKNLVDTARNKLKSKSKEFEYERLQSGDGIGSRPTKRKRTKSIKRTQNPKKHRLSDQLSSGYKLGIQYA